MIDNNHDHGMSVEAQIVKWMHRNARPIEPGSRAMADADPVLLVVLPHAAPATECTASPWRQGQRAFFLLN
jgi:hypothetical protein